MSFLETITGWGDGVLVPVSKIELIWVKYGTNGWEIHIKGQGDYEWVECFEKDNEKLNKRWEQIKKILGVAK